MRTTRSCLSLLALTLSFTPLALAQFSDPVMTAQAPRPGSYHDYIGIGAEVVNPTDGSLSFDLPIRSEEHTSELQSRENLVCRLLLEKKKEKKKKNIKSK